MILYTVTILNGLLQEELQFTDEARLGTTIESIYRVQSATRDSKVSAKGQSVLVPEAAKNSTHKVSKLINIQVRIPL